MGIDDEPVLSFVLRFNIGSPQMSSFFKGDERSGGVNKTNKEVD